MIHSAISLTALLLAAAAAPVAPDQFLADLYAERLAAEQAGDPDAAEDMIISGFSLDLLAAYERTLERSAEIGEPLIDFDVFYDAQDWDPAEWTEESFSTELIAATPSAAKVTVSFAIFGEPRELLFLLESIGTEPGWAVSDIDYGDMTLRQMLDTAE